MIKTIELTGFEEPRQTVVFASHITHYIDFGDYRTVHLVSGKHVTVRDSAELIDNMITAWPTTSNRGDVK